MKNTLKDFYEEYWEYRKSIGKIHTTEGAYIPKRLKTAVSMIAGDDRRIKILDIGCGEGTFGMLLKNKHQNSYVAGCDISEKSLELASPYYDMVVQLDINEDNLKNTMGDTKFDYIICIEVLEHLLNPESALNKCREVLSEEGYLITSFPNIAWWKYRIKLLKGHFPEESRAYHHAEHLHDFTLHTFTQLLKKTNLEILEIGGDFIPPEFMKRLRPKIIVDRLMKKYPNLFGYQIVLKTRMA